MNFPEDLKYVKSHEWIKVEGDTATIGITDFAQSELGDIVFVDFTSNPGDALGAGAAFGTIEAVKTVSDIYMPVSGEILEINTEIADSPEVINRDPYGEGWLIKIASADLNSAELMDAKAYAEMVGA